jgi:hypothetical protein
VRRRWLGLALVLAAGAGQAAETPSAVATPSKTEVGVGEVFSVDVKVSGPPGTSWTFPVDAGNDTVELRTAPPETRPGAAPSPLAADRHRYQAAAFALGDVELPAIPATYRLADGTPGETSTAALKLRVVPALPKDPSQQQLVDIREPQPLAAGLAFWIAVALLVLVIASLSVWLWRRQRRPLAATAAAAPERPPDAEAREALDRLAGSGLLARGELRAYYIGLAEIAKRYLERRLGAPVLEMTSTETVAFLRDHAHGQGLAAPMRDLAAAADQVKFARGSAQVAEAERHLAVARQMIDALEARMRPPEPAAPGAKVA